MSKELEEVQGRLARARSEKEANQTSILRLNEKPRTERNQTYADAVNRARRNIEHCDAQISELELHERKLLDQVASIEGAKAEAVARIQAEERGFWFRRFYTSLAIGNGAAMAAVANHLFNPDTAQATVRAGLTPFVCFASGVVLAGTIPMFLGYNARKTATTLTVLSAGLFLGGLVATAAALVVIGWSDPQTASNAGMAVLAPMRPTR